MIGTSISHYRILEKLGEGGMGVVYKAEDTKLNRPVALKFLPEHVRSSEPDKARFLQEAQAAAALSHPNICTVYGIEEHDGHVFIAMEYVEGQTLHDKVRPAGTIHESPLATKQAIEIGIQLADGLAAAHEKGIVHRDLKPENIMIRKDGRVQIMDFGLAKLKGASRLTKDGSTIGTAGYMSPEQVQGQDADHRTDIFSLGVILYELFAGQSPFKGAHETAINYEIVNVDPDPISAVRPDIDPELDRIIFECLQKEPDERYQAVKDVSKDLKRFKRETSRSRVSRISTTRSAYAPPAGESGSPAGVGQPTTLLDRFRLANLWQLSAIGFFVSSVALLIVLIFRTPAISTEVVRAFIPLPERHNYSSVLGGGHLAISPNGRKIAFVATDSSGRAGIWIRAVNALSATLLSGTDGAIFPFWSPDSRYIGFFSGGKLKKIEATGGPTFTICDVINPRGGSWNQSGSIVFAPDQFGGIFQVSDAGGSPKQITTLDTTRDERLHRWPYFLPDGNHFLYFARTTVMGSGSEQDAFYVASLDGKLKRRLIVGASNVGFANGYLLYMRENSLMAHAFDPDAFELKGDPTPLVESIQYSSRFSVAAFSVSQTGILVYQGSSSASTPELALVDTKGKKITSFGQPEIYTSCRLSNDARKIAMEIYDIRERNADIWVHGIERNVRTRLTFDKAVDVNPVWSRDGSSIVFRSNRKGRFGLYEKITSGAANEQLLFESDQDKTPTDWSLDGKYLLFHSADPKMKNDLWILPMTGEHKAVPFLQTEYSEFNGRFSPDQRWVAYQSDESGRNEVYVRPFPGAGAKWQVSTNGGGGPRWHRSGKQVFYVSAGKIMVAEVNGTGSTFEIGKVREYFDPSSLGGTNILDLSDDGQKILLQISGGARNASVPLTLVVNWAEGLKQK